MIRRASLGILCLAVIAAAIWWLVPHDAIPQTTHALPQKPGDAFEMTVESVHDGDTLRARVSAANPVVTDSKSTRVRLIGVDTPETSPRTECWGTEAAGALTALIPPGSTIWVAPDHEVLDRYGRHLLYVWTTDGRFVNAEMVSRGDGSVMILAPNTRHEELLRTLEAEAADAARGRWAAC